VWLVEPEKNIFQYLQASHILLLQQQVVAFTHILYSTVIAQATIMIDERSFSKEYPPLHFMGIELSNQLLLTVAAFSFLFFVVAEIIGALASNSLSLLGDAGAMSVDVFTVCNIQ
jgi:hypothetical protein